MKTRMEIWRGDDDGIYYIWMRPESLWFDWTDSDPADCRFIFQVEGNDDEDGVKVIRQKVKEEGLRRGIDHIGGVY